MINVDFINIFVGLILTSLAYHILSSLKIWLDSTKMFSWSCALKGILQGIIIGVAIAITYLAAQLVPDITVANIGGDDVSLIMALKLVITMAYVAYAYKTIKAIAMMFGLSVNNIRSVEYDETDEPEIQLIKNAQG